MIIINNFNNPADETVQPFFAFLHTNTNCNTIHKRPEKTHK